MLRFALSLPALVLLSACGAGEIRALYSADERRVRIAGIGAYGIFDPSFAPDPAGGIWMSLSSVDPSYHRPVKHPHTVTTALAKSEDGGRTWRFTDRVSVARDVL